MKYIVILVVLFNITTLYSIPFTNIVKIDLVPLESLLNSGKVRINKNIQNNINSSFAPTFSTGTTFNYLGTNFNETDFSELNQRLTNRIGLTISFNIPEIIKTYNQKEILVNDFITQTTDIYLNIIKRIYMSKTIIKNIVFLKDLRKAIIDFEKQISIDDKIIIKESELLTLYQEIITLQLQLYKTAGIDIGFDSYNVSYDVVVVSDIFNNSLRRVESNNK